MNAPVRPPSPENASPEQVMRAILATDFRAFVDYVFGLLRPGIPFRVRPETSGRIAEFSEHEAD